MRTRITRYVVAIAGLGMILCGGAAASPDLLLALNASAVPSLEPYGAQLSGILTGGAVAYWLGAN